MKVLFVSSGNKSNQKGKPGTVVYKQGESLKKSGIKIEYFLVQGKGLVGYIQEARRLKKYLNDNFIDIIHAHYTLSAWTAVLARPRRPIVLSLMGTDAYGEYIGENKILFKSRYLIFLTYLIQPFVRKIICKSKHIQRFVYLKRKSTVIPNGVSFNNISKKNELFLEVLAVNKKKQYILFFADPENIRKNFSVVQKAYNILNEENIELINPYPSPHEEVIKYLKSSDVLVVPSFMEGSPNIVKEAMACNCPVVATDVGDIRWLFGSEPGHFITSFDPMEVAEKIKQALEFSAKHGRTNGRKRIIELGLDSETVAKRIICVYQEVLEKRKIGRRGKVKG